MGPLLWNVGYDATLNASLPTGVYLICYADDTLLIACGRQWSRTTRLMEAGIEAVVRKIKGLGLEIATHKTEATWFHGLPRNKKPPESWIAVGEDRVRVGRRIKYLGLILDDRLNYKAHFEQLAPRVEKAAVSLGRLLPNERGPSLKVRRLYTSVIQSIMLYGAPIWAGDEAMDRKNISALRGVQRRMALRAIRAYRTVSEEAALILAKMVPFDFLAKAYAEAYWETRENKAQGREGANSSQNPIDKAIRRARTRWKEELVRKRAGERRVAGAILPHWEKWWESNPPGVTYRVTQVLTGHGCFGKYLGRIGAEQTAECHHCGAEYDTAQHTLAECSAFESQRRTLIANIGDDLSPAAIIKGLLAEDAKREAIFSYCEEVMGLKEAAERGR